MRAIHDPRNIPRDVVALLVQQFTELGMYQLSFPALLADKILGMGHQSAEQQGVTVAPRRGFWHVEDTQDPIVILWLKLFLLSVVFAEELHIILVSYVQ